MTTDVDMVLAGSRRWSLHAGDCLPWLRSLPDGCCDSLVTDPPAGIKFMGAKWDSDKGGRAQWIAWLAEILGECRRVLRPGGHGLVWALPRTSHWTATALEDAGFAIREILTHHFGSGFPKSRSLTKPASEHWILIKAPGALRDLEIDACRVGCSKGDRTDRIGGTAARFGTNTYATDAYSLAMVANSPAHPAGRWPPNALFSHDYRCTREGERRVVGRNPGNRILVGTNTTPNTYAGGYAKRSTVGHADPDGQELIESWKCVEGCPVRALDLQSGERRGMGVAGLRRGATTDAGMGYGRTSTVQGAVVGFGDPGTASRFYPQLPADDLDTMERFRYVSKPSTSERNASTENNHPTIKSIALLRWLTRLVTPRNGVVLEPFAGSGTTIAACIAEGFRCIAAEQEPSFAAIVRARAEHAEGIPAAPVVASAPDLASAEAPSPCQLRLFAVAAPEAPEAPLRLAPRGASLPP